MKWSISLHLLFLHALLLFAHFCEASLQVITALQGLLKFSLHVVYLKGLCAQNKTYSWWVWYQEDNTLKACTEYSFIPPRLFPSPGEQSYSPSKSFETPVDLSAGTSTADMDNSSERFCVDQVEKATTTGNAYLQLKCIDFLSVAGVSLTFVLHHLPVRLTGHQTMHVVI